jgi:3-deoxy-D-manno-octulosonate 8-phosphate phosphatase (KDO 8-P phosphatase)
MTDCFVLKKVEIMPEKINRIDIGKIKLIVYDFDGVMTDNRVLVDQNGKESVFCNRSDGLAIAEIKKMGIEQVIVSTETNKVVEMRAKKLALPVIQGVGNKKQVILEYCKQHNVNFDNLVYFGNDLNDLEAMKLAKYSIVPIDSSREIKEIASIITNSRGGQGVIREFLNMINKN